MKAVTASGSIISAVTSAAKRISTGVPLLWYACIYVELCRFPYPSLQLQSFSEYDILLLLDLKEGKENAEASDR